DTPLGSGVSTQINIPVSTQGSFSQLIALGIKSDSADTARVLSVFDARSVPHQPSLGVFSPDQQNIAGISWEGNNGAVYLKTTGGGIGLRSGTTDLLTVTATGQLGLSNNARGYNVPIGNGANAVGVTFADAYPDANYAVLCTPSYSTTCFISGKSASGFTLHLGAPAPDGNQVLDWLVTR
ncbi:MAG TPA: hypothetical protein VN554_00910, partial [Verrucomicrobiae bacterium]|nr:hypothetical protein [Verrucomicrobiae bacterium]